MRLHFHILRLNTYWYLRGTFFRVKTAALMIIKGEQRTYVTYSTGELINVTGWNYLRTVKIDGDEVAVLNIGSNKWSKCYLF